MAKISEELQMIDSLLMEFHERIQSGRCLTSKQQNAFMLDFLHRIANKDEPSVRLRHAATFMFLELPLTGLSRKAGCLKAKSGKDGLS